MEIIYHGHSCMEVKEYSFIIDPFIKGNPQAVTSPEQVKAKYILLTHGHADHTSDALEIAKRNNAVIIATHELANFYASRGVETISMNIGGTVNLSFGKVQMTQAFHSSSIVDEEGKEIYAGMPGGYLIRTKDFTLFHAGDTSLFTDLKLIGEKKDIDIAFLPIGDTFTMGPEEATIAAEWLHAKLTMPIHFNTFPPIEQDPNNFIEQLSKRGLRGIVLNPGQVGNF